MKSVAFMTFSDKETVELGRRLGSLLTDGDVVALTGELGSGKTWFTKGIALGLGVAEGTVVASPSFAIANEYQGRCPFIHMDLYRLESLSEFVSAGLEEFFCGEGVAAVEWADRLPDVVPQRAVNVLFRIVNEHVREITFSGFHPRSLEILEAIRSGIGSQDSGANRSEIRRDLGR